MTDQPPELFISSPSYANADAEQKLTVDAVTAAVRRIMDATYEPTGVVIHPIDHGKLRIAELNRTEPDPEVRRITGEQIAAAFDVPLWMMGVEGYRPPLRVRLRALPRRARAAVRRTLFRLPGVDAFVDYDDGWHRPLPRGGRWWIRVGTIQLGHRPEEEWW